MLFVYDILILVGFFTVFWAIAQVKKNNAIVDVGWGLGFVVLAAFSLFYRGFDPVSFVAIAVTVLVALWGFRLFFYISVRNFGKPEDYRYREMRVKWGPKHQALKAYFKVFLPQALFMFLIAAPIHAAALDAGTASFWWSVPGIVFFLVGFFFEAVGDAQLRHFVTKPENKGKIMRTGLWRYTRHPNYFGEIVMWWSLFLIVLPTTWGFLAIVSPVTITYLLVKVSGIPLLEKKYQDNPAFQEYAKKTSVLFPWLPRK